MPTRRASQDPRQERQEHARQRSSRHDIAYCNTDSDARGRPRLVGRKAQESVERGAWLASSSRKDAAQSRPQQHIQECTVEVHASGITPPTQRVGLAYHSNPYNGPQRSKFHASVCLRVTMTTAHPGRKASDTGVTLSDIILASCQNSIGSCDTPYHTQPPKSAVHVRCGDK